MFINILQIVLQMYIPPSINQFSRIPKGWSGVQISGVSSWKKNSMLTDFFKGKSLPNKKTIIYLYKIIPEFKNASQIFSPNNTNYLYKHLYYVCKCQYLFRNFLMRYDAIVFQTFVSMIAYQLWLALIF